MRGVWWRATSRLQQRPPEQCHRLHHAEGHARGTTAGDPRRARPKAGGGAKATADSSPASRLTHSSRSVGRGGAEAQLRLGDFGSRPPVERRAVMRFSFLILLSRSSEAVAREGALQSASQEPESPGGACVAQENASLRQELTSTRQYLQSVIGGLHYPLSSELRVARTGAISATPPARSTCDVTCALKNYRILNACNLQRSSAR
jgi:hypothetical protein